VKAIQFWCAVLSVGALLSACGDTEENGGANIVVTDGGANFVLFAACPPP